jgi:hypothetical protein
MSVKLNNNLKGVIIPMKNFNIEAENRIDAIDKVNKIYDILECNFKFEIGQIVYQIIAVANGKLKLMTYKIVNRWYHKNGSTYHCVTIPCQENDFTYKQKETVLFATIDETIQNRIKKEVEKVFKKSHESKLYRKMKYNFQDFTNVCTYNKVKSIIECEQLFKDMNITYNRMCWNKIPNLPGSWWFYINDKPVAQWNEFDSHLKIFKNDNKKDGRVIISFSAIHTDNIDDIATNMYRLQRKENYIVKTVFNNIELSTDIGTIEDIINYYNYQYYNPYKMIDGYFNFVLIDDHVITGMKKYPKNHRDKILYFMGKSR